MIESPAASVGVHIHFSSFLSFGNLRSAGTRGELALKVLPGDKLGNLLLSLVISFFSTGEQQDGAGRGLMEEEKRES